MAASSSTVAVDPSPLKFDSSMAASSSSSAVAADSRPLKYDVFISFRGETRNSFTSHLYFALCQKHIKVYIDEVSLKKGDDISRALPKAIEESAISISIFSENYADSRWCLDELVHILKCREEKDQIVLPIFYGIDPSHIRHQKGTYDAAFLKHQGRLKDEMEKVEEWRQALRRAADLSGWDLRGKSESVLVQQVVEDVISKLQSISSISIDDLKGLVGIRRQLCEIESLLCFDLQNVGILGIWGMGGIGKTTLARAVFKCFSNQFEGACFLESVREESQRQGLVKLEKEMFSKLLGEENPDVHNPHVNTRLSRTKALLVLDDVDHSEQLRRLAGYRDRFGPGSRIILTSRDLQVLNQLIDVRYEVQALDLENEASQLFYLKAFKENSCRTGFEKISRRVVGYTKGHPLALQVLGAFFCSLESIKEWKKELKKLKRIPKDEIQVVLKRSYDALDAEEKGLFLDIACYFKGERRDFVEGILEGKPIRGLVNKSLITIEDGRIHMHDLIQEMGRKLGERSRLWITEDVSFVLENNKGTEAIEGIYFPWIDQVVHLRPDVFEEMRKLRLLKFYRASNYYAWCKVKVAIDGDLKYLPNSLRYLHWEYYPGKSLPSNFKPQNLVELHMPNSELEQLWDGVQKLGSLKHINLHDSKLLTKIPDLSLAPKLECINLSGCKSLIHIPSLNLNLQATVDESAFRHQWLRVEDEGFRFRDERTPGCIILNGCWGLTTLLKVSGNIRRLVLRETALKELPSSIQSLENLLLLDLRKCMELKSLPKLPRNIELLLLDHSGIEQIPSSSIEGLCSLRQLNLRECKSLSSLPSNINLKALEELILAGTSIQELPSTIGMLYNLETLHIDRCNNLQSLPESIGMLYKLKKLDIRNCKNLQSVPASIGELCNLKSLDIQNCENLQSVPESIGMLSNLETLRIDACKNLPSVPASIGMLYNLKWLSMWNCKNLQSLPESIGMLSYLETLRIDECKNLQSVPASIGMLCNLKSFDIRKCENLQSLPASIGMLSNLETLLIDECKNLQSVRLSLWNCKNLQSVPASIGMLCNLKSFNIRKCENLQSLSASIGMLSNLEKLCINGCKNLQSVPASIGMLCNLKWLSMWNCKNLQSVPASIGKLCNLKSFDISKCKNLQSLPASIGMLYNLKELDISGCKNLQSVPASIVELCNLKSFNISECETLQSVPESIGMLSNLATLCIDECKNLQSVPASIGMLYKLKKLYITGCQELQSLPELPLFIESVKAEYCFLLKKVSSLRSTFTLGRWLDKYDSDTYCHTRVFSFINCANLGKDAINNIFREFLYKVFCTATTPPEVIHSEAQRVIGKVVVCYPTKEIPRWFDNQSEGSSITITLPPNWYNPKTFLGFVVSFIFVEGEDGDSDVTECCNLCLSTNKDYFCIPFGLPKSTIGSSDHIVMSYTYFDHSKENFEKYQKASLRYWQGPRRAKRCGLRMLYLKDAVEESDDGIIANFESWRIDSDTDYATTYDSDEPPPKRTRNL